jgi:Mn2+/Fe2+ NRAMP family transporter
VVTLAAEIGGASLVLQMVTGVSYPVIAATALMPTTIDPVTVTLFAVVLGGAAVPLTYFPILIVASDARLMGAHVNRRWSNGAGTGFRASWSRSRWPPSR